LLDVELVQPAREEENADDLPVIQLDHLVAASITGAYVRPLHGEIREVLN